VKLKPGRGYRHALSSDEISRLLNAVPQRRAVVYLASIYTGLRRCELNGLTWGDFSLDGPIPFVRVPGSISKNGRTAQLGLRSELVAALVAFRPDVSQSFEWVFRGKVPKMYTFKRDLQRAGIPLVDEHGRRVDFHSLRTTFVTHLQVSGVSPRAVMEMARHSDMRLSQTV
jgi:integrase